jgi:hypothetical protein
MQTDLYATNCLVALITWEFDDLFFNSLLHCANYIICIPSSTPGYSYLFLQKSVASAFESIFSTQYKCLAYLRACLWKLKRESSKLLYNAHLPLRDVSGNSSPKNT